MFAIPKVTQDSTVTKGNIIKIFLRQMYPDNVFFVSQISDAEETMGVIRTEPIQVIAEAYDVAVDIAFPKGRSVWCKYWIFLVLLIYS